MSTPRAAGIIVLVGCAVFPVFSVLIWTRGSSAGATVTDRVPHEVPEGSRVGQSVPDAPSAMTEILAQLNPATHHIELRFNLDYIDPSQKPDAVRRRTRTIALMADDRFLVRSVARDVTPGAKDFEQAVAFDGEYASLRSSARPDWLIVSRGYQVWPELAAIGLLDQSGRGLGWFGEEGRTLSLAPAPIVARRTDRNGAVRSLLLAPAEEGDGSRRSIELILDRGEDGFDRILSMIEQELEPNGHGGAHQIRRLSIIPAAWSTIGGLHLPARTEFRSERPGIGGRIQREVVMIDTVAAERVSEEHVDAAIEAFARPRRGETILLVERRMLYRIGDSSFQVEGVRYEAPEPLGEPSTIEIDRLLSVAQRVGSDVSGRASVSTASFGRWASVALGVSLIVLSAIIWRRK